MRFKSENIDGFQVFAVAGVNTVSFGIDAGTRARKGLLGFGVVRIGPGNARKTMNGFKAFARKGPKPTEDTRVPTTGDPIQSFVWDDFTAEQATAYRYEFRPMRGRWDAPDMSANVVSVDVETEPLFTKDEGSHDVFFNRGVASSQAYSHKFKNLPPDRAKSVNGETARDWLSRKLDDAIFAFIDGAKRGQALRCCFYEFHYVPVIERLVDAMRRGVDVQIIVDEKRNGRPNKKTGRTDPDFPREANLKAMKAAGLPKDRVIAREARTSSIQHNKFMVLLDGRGTAKAVWTGSTNISDGGIHGQTNVGHWIREKDVAASYLAYWNVLSEDPGGSGEADSRRMNREFVTAVDALATLPASRTDIPMGTTPIFSPRSKRAPLDFYIALLDSAKQLCCITLAFGVSADFKKALRKHTNQSAVTFMLLEKEDKPNSRAREPFVRLNASNNVYEAFGAYLDDALYNWTRETTTQELKLNTHVVFIHSKFLLVDPLGVDPIVVTGSANFSLSSTTSNDENMVLIRGNHRVADIYFTEFNRIYGHYYFRSTHALAKRRTKSGYGEEAELLLCKDTSWLEKYAPGKLRQKRVELFKKMHIPK